MQELMGYRLSYVCRKNGRLKTVSGYFEEDLKYLVEDASCDSTFIAVVKESINKKGNEWFFEPVSVLYGFLPENFILTPNGYEEIFSLRPHLCLYTEPHF